MNIVDVMKSGLRLAACGCVFLLGAPVGAAAQTACPPGMIAYGTGGGLSSCGPDGSQNQASNEDAITPPPPIGRSRWGALATDAPAGVLGFSTDLFTRNMAVQSALADCKEKGGATCKLEIAYDNECAAVVVGSTGYNVATDLTLKKAIGSGMETCASSGATGCHLYYSACSLPVGAR